MQAIRTILIAIDFSECSLIALKQAARIAKWNNAALRVVHVIESSVISELARAYKKPVDEITRDLTEGATKEMAEHLKKVETPVTVQMHALVGHPLEAIMDAVKQHSADLLVIGMHGAGGRGEGVGTMATKCVRKSPVDVLLVHPARSDAFREIVACVDFSETSDLAVSYAVRIAVQDSAHLNLLHVYYGPWNRLHYRSPSYESSPDFQEQYKAGLREELESTLKKHTEEAEWLGNVNVALHENASYGKGITDFAREHDADLIVLGARGQSTLRYLILGSTAERVLREVPCSVLIARPHGEHDGD